MKKAICYGINNYPGTLNDLSGCVNDAFDWNDLLIEFEFETDTKLDNQVTGYQFLTDLKTLLDDSESGDSIVVTYSGHGTNIRDDNGDEPDGYDEALYLYDGVLRDDEIRKVIDTSLKDGVSLTLIMDSCFSGTVTRVQTDLTPRFVKLENSNPMIKSEFLQEVDMPELLLTGCSDSEYSYDALIDGRWNGAMTRMAINTIRENPNATWEEFYVQLQMKLPSNQYPQSPQLEGNMRGHVFETIEAPIDEPVPPVPVSLFELFKLILELVLKILKLKTN